MHEMIKWMLHGTCGMEAEDDDPKDALPSP